jgi:hypothetical protein
VLYPNVNTPNLLKFFARLFCSIIFNDLFKHKLLRLTSSINHSSPCCIRNTTSNLPHEFVYLIQPDRLRCKYYLFQFGCDEEYECLDGEKMIWDSKKPLECKCRKSSYMGQFCEKCKYNIKYDRIFYIRKEVWWATLFKLNRWTNLIFNTLIWSLGVSGNQA